MKNEQNLTPQAKLRRLRLLAYDALKAYSFKYSKLELLNHSCKQITYKIHTQKTTYILRLQQSNTYNTPSKINMEFNWLNSLQKHTNLIVPTPISTIHGKNSIKISHESIQDPYICSVTKWVEGKVILRKNGPGQKTLSQVGHNMAILHQHSQTYMKNKFLKSHHLDYQGLFSRNTSFLSKSTSIPYTKHQIELIKKVKSQCKTVMNRLGKSHDVFGLIHADLLQLNYIIHKGHVRFIDFADCGRGFYLYDLAVTCHGLWGLDEKNSQRDTFLGSYINQHPIPDKQLKHLPLFTAIRAISVLQFLEHLPTPILKKQLAHQFHHIKKVL